ncbi:MAG: ribonuclease HII [Candidatus Omnitrophota bacterium]|nr:ribonuclease HII [Candidatus Omnitrophota bacterium]
MLYYENKARKEGYKFIAGVDEVGRGPLAGPVVACAVLLKNKRFKSRIDDSKKLSERQRKNAFGEIVKKSLFGLGWVSERQIDAINILEATRLAMGKAIAQLLSQLSKERKISPKALNKQVCFLIDGNFFSRNKPYTVRNITGGDAKSLSIAAASIVAKVTRDQMMEIYDGFFPQYGFAKHKGYGTKEHLCAIEKFGPSVIHRKTFAPVKNFD